MLPIGEKFTWRHKRGMGTKVNNITKANAAAPANAGTNSSARGIEAVAAKIAVDPEFRSLVKRRDTASFIAVGLTMVIYFGYIFLLAFAPGIMNEKVAGTMTMGFPLALAVIVLTILIVAVYVWQANGVFQTLQDRIVRDATR